MKKRGRVDNKEDMGEGVEENDRRQKKGTIYKKKEIVKDKKSCCLEDV